LQASNYNIFGHADAEYLVATTPTAIPATGLVNDTGIWYTENRCANGSKATLLGQTVTTYAILPDTATTAFFKIIETEKDTFGATTCTSSIPFRITPTGAATRLCETGVAGNVGLTVAY
jgi:hypothetical protein